MRIKLKYPSKQIKLVLSTRQKRLIQRVLGYSFEAKITNEGLLLHSTKQKYRLSDLLAQCVDMPDFEEGKEWMTRKPVGREML
jgi:antitoxin component of MazEF toxin-antitoxin module